MKNKQLISRKDLNTTTKPIKTRNPVITFLKVLFVIILFILAFTIPILVNYSFFTAKDTVDNMYKPTRVIKENQLDKIKVEGLVEQTDAKLGILVMGVDNDSVRNIGSTRTDSLIYVAFNGETDELNMVTIPRDVYTEIYDGYGEQVNTAKINSAYTISEEDSTIETVQNYLGLPIDYFVTINFLSFTKIVDAIGGIEVNVPYNINTGFEKDNSGTLLIPEGKQRLNGEQALIFSRIRKMDNDIKRGERQQEVMEQVIQKTLNINNVTKYKEILDSVKGNVSMNLTFDNLKTIAGSLVNGFHINKHIFEWESSYVGQESVVHILEPSYLTVINDLKRTLEIKVENPEPLIEQ